MTNRRAWIQLLAVGALIVPATRGAEEPLPKAEVVLDRYLEVTGGKAAYEKRRGEVTTIEIEFVGRGVKGTLVRYADSSNNVYSSGEFEGIGKIEEGVYNGQAWDMNAMTGPRLKTGAENADSVREAVFNGVMNWRKYYKAEVTALETVDGDECYKLVLTPLGEGKPQTQYFSRKTGLLVKTARKLSNPMGEIDVDGTISGYERFDGILYPKKLAQNVMGNQMAITVVSVKSGEEIPKERFEPPAEIRKLMAK